MFCITTSSSKVASEKSNNPENHGVDLEIRFVVTNNLVDPLKVTPFAEIEEKCI